MLIISTIFTYIHICYPLLSFGVGKWVVIHVIITWITGVETMNGRPVLRMTVSTYDKVSGGSLSLRLIGFTSALSVTQKRRCSCSCRLLRYISVMPIPFTFKGYFAFYRRCAVMSFLLHSLAHWNIAWRRGSVVRTSVCSWRTFPDLRLIHG